jgi:hypothetical protein
MRRLVIAADKLASTGKNQIRRGATSYLEVLLSDMNAFSVVLLTAQALVVNRLAGLPYPLWRDDKSPGRSS